MLWSYYQGFTLYEKNRDHICRSVSNGGLAIFSSSQKHLVLYTLMTTPSTSIVSLWNITAFIEVHINSKVPNILYEHKMTIFFWFRWSNQFHFFFLATADADYVPLLWLTYKSYKRFSDKKATELWIASLPLTTPYTCVGRQDKVHKSFACSYFFWISDF